MLVVISTELSQRELEAHLLLANLLNSHGADVLICYDQIAMAVVRDLCDVKYPFVLIDKSGSQTCIPKRLAYIKDNPNAIAFLILQESFINLTEPDSIFVNYTSPTINKYVQGIFAFGNNQKKLLIKAHPHLADIVYSVGNPRHDLLGKFRYLYADRVVALKEIYGNFTLYTDAHPVPENHLSPLRLDHGLPPWKANSATMKKLQNELSAAQLYNREYIKAFMKDLGDISAGLSPDKFIIRPHPVNKASFWIRETELLRNCEVMRSMSFETWLHAAKCVVTNNCTTGIQAIAAGKKTISYNPIGSLKPSALDSVGALRAENPTELIKLIKTEDSHIDLRKKASLYIPTHGNASQLVADKVYGEWCKRVDKKGKQLKFHLGRFVIPDQPWKWEPQNVGELNRFLNKISLSTGVDSVLNQIAINTFMVRAKQ